MACKPEESLEEDKPPLDPIQRKIMILKILLKIARKKNSDLETEVGELRKAS